MSANRCPNCDYDELEPDDELCPACGYKLTQTNHVWIWLGIGAVVVLAVVAILWALPSPKPKSESAATPPTTQTAPPPATTQPPAAGAPATTRALVDRVLPGVVSIHVATAGKMGSGWVWDGAHGYVITNAHVVGSATSVTVVTNAGKELPGKVLGTDRTRDIALVQVDGANGLPALTLGDAKQVRPGDEVLAFGSPLGLENTVTDGLISAIRTDVPTEMATLARAFQTSAPIAPGSSGGPLVDKATGAVIGVNTAGVQADKAANIGFAVPVDDAITAAQQILKPRL